jgi:hypothetical protein
MVISLGAYLTIKPWENEATLLQKHVFVNVSQFALP